jgi:hypothetical protein
VYGQEISTLDTADAGIPTAAAADRTEDADTFEILFQHYRIVIEVLAVSALVLTRCFLSAKMRPPGQIHDEKADETHGVAKEKFIVRRGQRIRKRTEDVNAKDVLDDSTCHVSHP